MTSVVEIYNMALSNIGQSETVETLTERSKAQRTCTLWYENCRDSVLADFNWPFATKQEYLADIGSPESQWQFRYQMPVDCLKAIELVPEGMSLPIPAECRIPFQVGYGSAGNVIHTNEEEALLSYIVKIDDPNRFSPLFVDALAYLLAAKIAMPMSVKRETMQECMTMYRDAIQRAQVHAFEQGEQGPEPSPEFIRARN